MQRRDILLDAIAGSVGLVSGCLNTKERSDSTDAGGDIRVRNEDNENHTLEISISNDSETSFEKTIELDSSSTEVFPHAFGGGKYDVSVIMDNKTSKEHDLNVGNCSAITLHITINTTGNLEIQQDYCD